MKQRQISNQASVFIYDSLANFLTYVYLIEKKTRYFLIDTYCGSGYMEQVKDIISNRLDSMGLDKEVIVINTHFHWDHVWGNCSFTDNLILGHEKCRILLDKSWEKQLAENKQYILGRVEKILPNVTFKDSLTFYDEGVEVFYSPGHTEDSISIYDHEEEILYAGDNLEKPLIYLENDDISAYLKTLEKYRHLKPKKIMSGHTLDLAERDVLETIRYLELLEVKEELHLETLAARKIHTQNLQVISRSKN